MSIGTFRLTFSDVCVGSGLDGSLDLVGVLSSFNAFMLKWMITYSKPTHPATISNDGELDFINSAPSRIRTIILTVDINKFIMV